MKKIFTLCATLVAVTFLGTACSHSNRLNEQAAADNALVPREGTTADPVTTEHVAAVRSPAPVTAENNTVTNAVPSDTNKNIAPTTEPTAALDDANLGASSSGRGR